MTRRLWTVILCGGMIVTLSLGIRSAGGLFIRPMSMDLGVGREVFGLGVALTNLVWGLAAPFLGAIADRFGAGKTSTLGALIYVGGLLLLSSPGGPAGVIGAHLLLGLGITGAGLSVVLGAVGRVAPPEKRSVALGLVSAAGSIGQFAFAPISAGLLDGFGWHMALVILAVASLLMVPLSVGIAHTGATAGSGPKQSIGAALGEAFGHSGFWLLTAGFFVCGFHVVFVGTHLPGWLTENAMPGWVAAWALALIGLFNIVGSLGCGYLGQHYSRKNVLALLYLLRSVVFIFLLVVPLSPVSVLLFAAAFGLLYLGTIPLTSGLVAHLFGPAYMSMLYGVVFLSHQIGSFFGAWLGGLAFDRFGSYDAMWWLSVGLGLLAALLHWPISERPVARVAAAGAA